MTGTTAEETHGYDHDPDRDREPAETDEVEGTDETTLLDAADRPDGFTPRHATTDEAAEVDEGDGVATGHVHLPEEHQAAGTVYDHGAPVDDTDIDHELDSASDSTSDTTSDTTTDTSADAPVGAEGAGQVGKWWPDGASDEVMGRWREAQIAFVDDPAAAVRDGRAAVEDAVRRLTEALDAEVERVSATGNGDTEAMRQAMRAYRQVLDRLVAL
jgi:hypothetical protein